MSPRPVHPAIDSPQRIKIVRVIARLNIGGASIHAINLSSGMDEQRFESILVCGKENPGEGSMWDLAMSHNIQPVFIPDIVGQANLKLRDLRALIRIYRLFRRERPHIVDTHTAKAGLLGRLAAWLAGVPIIVHTYHGHVLQGYYSPLKSRALRFMEAVLARWTDCVVAVSEETKKDLVCLGITGEEKISVVHLGLHLKPFLDCERLRGQFREELALTAEVRLVGIVGRLFPVKNHRLFLEAARQVADAYQNVCFVIVGDGILREELESFSRQICLDDQVVFTGWRRDLPKIYSDLDVLVVSSVSEGTPVAAIEAMAAGCPVVATRVGGTPSLVEDGRTGLLVAGDDPAALSSAVVSILKEASGCRSMRAAARKAARQRFSMSRLITDMTELYDGLILAKTPLRRT